MSSFKQQVTIRSILGLALWVSVVGWNWPAHAQVTIAGPFTTTYLACNGPTSSPQCSTFTNGTQTYDYDQDGPCCATKDILYWAPTAPGAFPIFQWTSGTNAAPQDFYGPFVAKKMAEKGMIAFIPDYLNHWNYFLPATPATPNEGVTCTPLLAKAQNLSDPGIPTSAIKSVIAAISTNPVLNPSPGIVSALSLVAAAGHSQGSAMAGLAAQFNRNVRAVWGLATGDQLFPGGVIGRGGFEDSLISLEECGNYQNTKFHAVRAVNGEHDEFFGGVSAINQPLYNRWNLQDVTGVGVDPSGRRSTADVLDNASHTAGYAVVAENQVCTGAGHGYFACDTPCWCQQFYSAGSTLPSMCSADAPVECAQQATCATTRTRAGALICQAGAVPSSACNSDPTISCPTSGDVGLNLDNLNNVHLVGIDPFWSSTTSSWGFLYNASWLYETTIKK